MLVETITCDPNKVCCTEQRTFHVDYVFFYYLSKEFKTSAVFCENFAKTQRCYKFRFILLPTRYDLIDRKWNDRVTDMVRERCELDHALSWLSTLGGAFSALGDYFENYALIAGKISVNQLKLALRLGDPTIQSRCRLYFSLSLIQQQRYKLAKCIVLQEYEAAKAASVVDERLLKMCKGIWSKLQYEHSVSRSLKRIEKFRITSK